MPSKNLNAITSLPSGREFSEFVDELIYFERDYREWEKYKNSPNDSLLSRLRATGIFAGENKNAVRPPTSVLAPRKFSSDDEAEAAWSKIHELPAYKKLLQDQNFASALDSFQMSIDPSRAQEARFLAGVAFYINRFRLETENPELIKQPIERTRRSAANTARKLLMLAKQGARLENLQDEGKLDSLLVRLVAEMEKKPKTQPKNDKTLAGRLFVKRLALDFLGLFDKPLTSVVSNLAGVVGYAPDQRNIDIVVGQARREYKRKYRNALADALLSYR